MRTTFMFYLQSLERGLGWNSGGMGRREAEDKILGLLGEGNRGKKLKDPPGMRMEKQRLNYHKFRTSNTPWREGKRHPNHHQIPV